MAAALPWFGFWVFASLFLWVQHQQYSHGHETILFVHKTPEEKRIREAVIQKLENEAARGKPREQ